MAPFDRSKWVRTTPLTDSLRKEILDVGSLGTPVQDFVDEVKPVEDPLRLRKLVVHQQAKSYCDDHLKVVYDVVKESGAAAYRDDYPDLPDAVLHDVYQRAQDVKIDDDTVRRYAQDVIADVTPALYEEKIRRIFDDAGAYITQAKLREKREQMQRNDVDYGSRQFRENILGKQYGAPEYGYSKFFDEVPDAPKSVSEELPDLRGPQRARAIEVLQSLGVHPKYADDDDWGRIATAMVSFSPGAEGLSGVRPDFPEFSTAEDLGLDSDAIRTLADLYYIHAFDRAGTFDAVDHLAARFVDDTELDLGAAAPLLFVYMKQAADRLPADDRRKLTKRLFEGEPGTDTSFEVLMVRLSEAMTAFSNARSAGEILCDDGKRIPLSARRLQVHRAIEDLQRVLSRHGGGVAPFLAQEAGAQLIEAFKILQCDGLRCAIGADANADLFSVISLLSEKSGKGGSGPPPDQLRTLAVEGRRVIQALAQDADTEGQLSDDELDKLSGPVSAWYAAYRWPTEEKRGGAPARDESTAAASSNGTQTVIQLR